MRYKLDHLLILDQRQPMYQTDVVDRLNGYDDLIKHKDARIRELQQDVAQKEKAERKIQELTNELEDYLGYFDSIEIETVLRELKK